jgi:23S rRNA (adenine2030-N6)-methyltransferase
MLSYQHGYHAGNFADVHKHSLLSLVLESLRQKEKPFIGLDIYAGRGRYNLGGTQAQKTAEFHQGIAKLWPQTTAIGWPDELHHYRQSLSTLNPDQTLKYYPGSPTLMHNALRPHDNLQLCELHPAELTALQAWQQHHPQARIHARDAHESLNALLPPTIKRGVVLIDPSYEIKTEYLQITQMVLEGIRKWPQGIFMIWYPLLKANRHRDMISRLQQRCKLPMLQSELQVANLDPAADKGGGMFGSGMLIINPPWQLDSQIKAISPWMEQLCAKDEVQIIENKRLEIGSRLIWLREAE